MRELRHKTAFVGTPTTLIKEKAEKLQEVENEITETEGAGGIIATKITDVGAITDLVGVLEDLAMGFGEKDIDYAVSRPICATVTADIKSYMCGGIRRWYVFLRFV